MIKLVIYDKGNQINSYDITKEQQEKILSFIDYDIDQLNYISEITGVDKLYLYQDNVDFYIDW